jgi:hypothetical protein
LSRSWADRDSALVTASTFRCLSLIFLVYFCQTYAFILLPLEALRAAISPGLVGLLLVLPGGVGFLADVPLAAISDGRGRRLMIVAGGLTMVGLGSSLSISAPVAVVVAAILAGLALGLLSAPALAALIDVAPDGRQSSIQGWNGAAQAIASMAAAIGAGLMFEGQQSIAALPIAVAGLLIAGLALGLPADAGARPIGLLGSYGRAFLLFRFGAIRTVGLLAVAYGLLFLVIGNTFVPLYLVSSVGIAPSIVGLGLAIRPILVMVGSPTFGHVVPRTGVLLPTVLLTLLSVVGIAITPLASIALGLAFLALALQGTGIVYSAAAANVLIARATVSTERAVAIAATNLGSRLTLVLAGPLLGVFYAQTPTAAFLGGAALLAGVAGLIWRERLRLPEMDPRPA